MSGCSEFFSGTHGCVRRSFLLLICIPYGRSHQIGVDRALEVEGPAERFAAYGLVETLDRGVQVRSAAR